MENFKTFFKTSILGGLVVILPVAIFFIAAKWLFGVIVSIVKPLTGWIMTDSAVFEFFLDVFAIGLMVMICFAVGVFVRTKLGKWFYETIEEKLFKLVPGYSLIKDTVLSFIGNKKAPFSSVVLVQLFENDVLATAFVTDRHDDRVTVFVPTGPNPTSGLIYHVKNEYVHEVDISVEQAMRSIISCGAGTEKLYEKFKKEKS